MDMLDADEEEGFSFIWTIQNYNFCFRKNKDTHYVSPMFVLNDKSVEKWTLNLYPERYFSHDSIGLALQKCTGKKVTTANNFSFGNPVTNQGFGSPATSLFGRPTPNAGFGSPAPNPGFGSSSAPNPGFGSPAPNPGSGSSSAPNPGFGSPVPNSSFGSSPATGLFGQKLGVVQQSHPQQSNTTDQIILEISIRDVRGSFIKKPSKKLLFDDSLQIDIWKLKIAKEELDTYLENDSLTIKCRVCVLKNKICTKQCYARTIIDVEKITYECAVEGFQDLENGGHFSNPHLIFSDAFSFTMDLFPTRETYAENKLQVKITLTEPKKPCYSICEISLVGAGGNIAHSTKDEYNFDFTRPGQVWTFPVIEVGRVLYNKELFLSNGVLRLLCEFGFSSGVTYNKIERIDYARRNNHQLQCYNQTTDSDSLMDNLQRFYNEGKFSDLTIRTPSKEFRVHKLVLCARSKYFSNLIQNDRKINQTGVLEIEDIDDDTVSKMLLFLYTDTIGEDPEFRKAATLYFVADKYRIIALKRMCSNFLKDNFSVTNVCDVLVLADMHQDQDLKSAAQSFIFKHNVKDSEEWKKFMKENVNLASEVMYAMLKNIPTG